VPQLNVDGTEIAIHGLSEDCPTGERLERANGSSDFSRWQANARGVDLNHNYNARFYEYKEIERAEGLFSASPTRWSGEYPESEPETACLANYLRYNAPRLVLSFHSQGEEIYGDTGEVEGADGIAMRLSAYTGYRLAKPEGGAGYGGLSDWYRAEMHLPAFTVECGKGKNPLPLSDGEGIYSRVRRMLFCAPTLV
jgi:g-D-glutamyl-meso-diaminopimelate peptidase